MFFHRLSLFFVALFFCTPAALASATLVEKYEVAVPKNLTVHSISGIFHKDHFILAYYAAPTAYQHGGVATSTQEIYITSGIPGHWHEPVVAASPNEVGAPDCSCFDPVVFQTHDKVYLFYRIGHSPRDCTGFVKISYDGGACWTDPIPLPENILGPAKSKPLLSRNGTDLLCGSSFQKDNSSVTAKQDGWVRFDTLLNFENADNFAKPDCWKVGQRVGFEFKGAGSVVIQPAMWIDGAQMDTIHALCRANTGKLVYARSNDFGLTWTQAEDSELPSNYSAISIEKTTDGTVFMAWNPLEKDPNSKSDARYELRLSELMGKDARLLASWGTVTLECDPSQKTEFSFPSIIASPSFPDKLFVAYGIDRKKIMLAEVHRDA